MNDMWNWLGGRGEGGKLIAAIEGELQVDRMEFDPSPLSNPLANHAYHLRSSADELAGALLRFQQHAEGVRTYAKDVAKISWEKASRQPSPAIIAEAWEAEAVYVTAAMINEKVAKHPVKIPVYRELLSWLEEMQSDIRYFDCCFESNDRNELNIDDVALWDVPDAMIRHPEWLAEYNGTVFEILWLDDYVARVQEAAKMLTFKQAAEIAGSIARSMERISILLGMHEKDS